MPQAILSSEHGSLNPQQLPETAVKLDGVNRVAPITTVMWYCKARAAWRSG